MNACENVIKHLLLTQLSDTPHYTTIIVKHELMNQAPKEISRELGISKSSVTAYIGKLRNAVHMNPYKVSYCIHKYGKTVKAITEVSPVMTKVGGRKYLCRLCGNEVMMNRKILHLTTKHNDYVNQTLNKLIKQYPPQPIKIYTPEKGILFINKSRKYKSHNGRITVNI